MTDRDVPEVFQGEVPAEFKAKAIEKYGLAKKRRIARFLSRIFYTFGPGETEESDLIVRSLYKQQIAEQEQEEDKFDELTVLMNRRYFKKNVDELLPQIRGGHRPTDMVGGVFFKIDIVDFKAINGELGYPAGDKYLVAAAEFLQDAIRDTDLISRWGGDEYVIFAPTYFGSTSEQVRTHIAERFNEIPQQDGFPKQFRWNYAEYEIESNMDTQTMIDSIDITTDEGKAEAFYTQANALYSNT